MGDKNTLSCLEIWNSRVSAVVYTIRSRKSLIVELLIENSGASEAKSKILVLPRIDNKQCEVNANLSMWRDTAKGSENEVIPPDWSIKCCIEAGFYTGIRF